MNNALYPATRTTKVLYFSGFFCASNNVSRVTTLNCICIPFWSKYERMSAENLVNPDIPASAEGWNFWFKSVPFEATPCSSLATEFAVAVGPFTSLPDAGPIPSARGVNANLPSGVAPVCPPRGTFADTGYKPAWKIPPRGFLYFSTSFVYEFATARANISAS